MSCMSDDISTPTFKIQSSVEFDSKKFIQDATKLVTNTSQRLLSTSRTDQSEDSTNTLFKSAVATWAEFLMLLTSSCNTEVKADVIGGNGSVDVNVNRSLFKLKNNSNNAATEAGKNKNQIVHRTASPKEEDDIPDLIGFPNPPQKEHKDKSKSKSQRKQKKIVKLKGHKVSTILKYVSAKNDQRTTGSKTELTLEKAEKDKLVIGVKNIETGKVSTVSIRTKKKSDLVSFVKKLKEKIKKIKDLPKILKEYAENLFIHKVSEDLEKEVNNFVDDLGVEGILDGLAPEEDVADQTEEEEVQE